MNCGRVIALARLEARRLLRMRIAFTLLVVVPLLQVILFGLAIRPDAPVRVVIAAPTIAVATRVAGELAREPNLIVAVQRMPGEAETAVREGRALIGIEVPEIRSLANPFAPLRPVRVIVDATSPALTEIAAARVEAAYWRAVVTRAELTDSDPGLRIERLHNAQARADWTFLSGLIGVTVMIAMVMLGALSLAREREGGTWEALRALPFRLGELLIGKALPNVVIGTLQGMSVLAIAVMAFDLPMRGSVLALVVLLPLLAAAHFVLGNAIAARSGTQLAALQAAVAFYLPAMLLSGFLYPFQTLPGWAQVIGNLFPLTHFIRAAQGALLRGDGASEVLQHGLPIIVALAVFAVAALALQARRLDRV
jgi:ABC-2 type transport system permease protein